MMITGAMDGMRRASATARPEVRRRLPTTIGFAAVPDHVRLPARFFGRFTACAAASLS
ncbi:MAG TPA: hypothetical protein VLA00_11760 [Xanthobacteraceae bacterium]|nr:hypothetical protein [Xanthobacteraceae bacterium]